MPIAALPVARALAESVYLAVLASLFKQPFFCRSASPCAIGRYCDQSKLPSVSDGPAFLEELINRLLEHRSSMCPSGQPSAPTTCIGATAPLLLELMVLQAAISSS